MAALIITLIVLVLLAIIYFGLVLTFLDRDIFLRFDYKKLKTIPWKFGQKFLWGSATAAYQVEGNCFNTNWRQFESAIDEQGNPKIEDGQQAGAACDEWNLYKEDIQLMKDISINSYRFSVEWSKIEPRPAEFDEAALDHYEQMVDELLSNGIEPMVTLHHFTNPIWFEDDGGFLQDNSPEIFARFTEKVVQRLGTKVNLWCTINEPAIYALFGYFTAEFPPGLKDAKKAARAYLNMLHAHAAAYKTIKKMKPEASVGLVIHVALFDPPHWWSLLDLLIARMLNANMNESHFEYITRGRFEFSLPGVVHETFEGGDKQTFDYVGLNYYTNHFRVFKPRDKEQFIEITKAPQSELTDMGWTIYPEGLYRSIKMIRRYTNKPIYITENGIADAADNKRAHYIEDHLLVLNKAVADGFDVRGYYYWSLLDNFEWAKGFKKRFGLYHVDFNTQKRTLYEGSKKYTEIIGESNK
ncbi:MAG: family 1 glycosylhydrolase [Dehalococcoidia bacterium]|nr:family 1 glycosylhydrolase [Dehalococcoidia bacterium]